MIVVIVTNAFNENNLLAYFCTGFFIHPMPGFHTMLHYFSKLPLWLKTIGVLFVLLIISAFLLRGSVLRHQLEKYSLAFEKAYPVDISIGKASFTGINGIELNDFLIIPRHSDTLLSIAYLKVSISLRDLLFLRLRPSQLEAKNLTINLYRNDSITNYMFLLTDKKSKKLPAKQLSEPNYGLQAENVFDFLFGKLPSESHFTNLMLRANLNGNSFAAFSKDYVLSGNSFRNEVFLQNNDTIRKLILKGSLDRSRQKGSFTIYPEDSTSFNLPYFDWKYSAFAGFDTLRFSIHVKKAADDNTLVLGEASVSGLHIQQSALSEKKINIASLSGKYHFTIGRHFIALDSVSHLKINEFDIHPYARIQLYPEKIINISINKPWFDANELFRSLPKGLFRNLHGMETEGELNYHFLFSLELNNPDSLIFESRLKGRQFRIKKYGNTFFGFINEDFTYTAWEKGVAVKTFEVGPGNPSFRRLEQISPYLRSAIITSEDGGFFLHRGFLPDAFRESLITNIKEKRFVRGGSTISMQLVKNVYLNRNKTITRKLEEALIVWIIENNRIVTKERMFEVYLNIIEMGPGIYGVADAARFYFDKDVSKLSFSESVFMASIVPRPKWFKYSFDKDGRLRDFLYPYYELMGIKMCAKGFISENEKLVLLPDITLTGKAKQMLMQTDSVSLDTLSVYLPELLKE